MIEYFYVIEVKTMTATLQYFDLIRQHPISLSPIFEVNFTSDLLIRLHAGPVGLLLLWLAQNGIQVNNPADVLTFTATILELLVLYAIYEVNPPLDMPRLARLELISSLIPSYMANARPRLADYL